MSRPDFHTAHPDRLHGGHGNPGDGSAAATVAGARYTCPMHPDIVRDAPGHCPICGMALEPMMPSADDDEAPELRDFSRRFWWTLPLTAIVLGLAMLGHRTDLLSASQRSGLELALS